MNLIKSKLSPTRNSFFVFNEKAIGLNGLWRIFKVAVIPDTPLTHNLDLPILTSLKNWNPYQL
ncbi:hypothetical protein PITCH_A1100025 [uncultured Desulfobacterium sp.]|uniref:Uncharacterized protein n=1 Tax=uncultured Desulfobacterium sp. TaxID=201089 RepID=A0A445MR56_9BACT|nr:hypothetical protein PITCH_A1100025 [uncultured Desulfobacterium sp.]